MGLEENMEKPIKAVRQNGNLKPLVTTVRASPRA